MQALAWWDREDREERRGNVSWRSAAVYLAEDGAGQELVLQELGGQGVNVDSIQEGVQVLGSALHVPADPVCAGLIHLRRNLAEA